MKEKFRQYIANKSKIGLGFDILVVVLLIASLIPQTRMEVMTFLISGRMLVVQPSVIEAGEGDMLVESDYQMSFKSLNGPEFDFSTLKGKVVFLNFWATWCPPCVAELSAIQELYNLYKDNSSVAFVLVSNEAQEDVQKFITKKGYTFPVYLFRGKVPKVLSSSSIPTTFVISKTGKLIVREVGAVNWSGERMIKTMDTLVKE